MTIDCSDGELPAVVDGEREHPRLVTVSLPALLFPFSVPENVESTSSNMRLQILSAGYMTTETVKPTPAQ